MLKSFINKSIKAALSEIFTNANDSSAMSLSLGSDLFSQSSLNLKNLIIRPDLLDVLLQPLHLINGHIASLKLEGVAELAFGGKLQLTIENISVSVVDQMKCLYLMSRSYCSESMRI